MALPLHKQIPRRRADDGAVLRLALLSQAAETDVAALGPRPAALRTVVDALSIGAALPVDGGPQHPSLTEALHAIRAGLFAAPGREPEADRLWREALATAWLSAAIVRLTGGSPGSAGFAGLLHRAGDLFALRALAAVEIAEQVRGDTSAVLAACAALEPHLSTMLRRSWRLPPLVGRAMLEWRCPDGSSSSIRLPEARAVYFGHAFANQLLFAQFPSPGLAEAAVAGLRLDGREIAALQAGFEPLRQAVESLSSR